MKVKSPLKDLTLIQLFDRFATDDKARKHLESVLWKNGVVCPKCKCNDQTKFSDIAPNPNAKTRAGLRWCANCKDKFTVTIGTVFEDSKIPLRKPVNRSVNSVSGCKQRLATIHFRFVHNPRFFLILCLLHRLARTFFIGIPRFFSGTGGDLSPVVPFHTLFHAI